MEYDKYQRNIKTDVPAPNNQRAISSNVFSGYKVTSTNAKGQTKTITKNALGKITRVDEEESAYEVYAYEVYTYDALGNLKTTIDSADNKIVLIYDKFGNKTDQDDPDMGVWSYTYDALGQLKTQTDAKGIVTSIKYDTLGRKIEEDINGVVSTWQYDKDVKGKLHKESRPNFSRVYFYDKNLRPNVVTTTLDSKTFTQRFTYDSLGRVSTKTLPNNFIVKNVYNKYGYLEAIKSPKKLIKDFDPDHFVMLIEKTLESAAEYHRQSLEQIDKARELNAKAAYYKRVANHYSNYKERLLAYAARLEAVAKKYEYYGNKYKRYATYYKARADRYLSLSNYYSSKWWGSWAERYFKRLSDKYNWYSARYAYYSNYYLKRALAYQNRADWIESYAERVEDYVQRKADYYLALATKTIEQSNQAIEIAKQCEVKSEQGYTANAAYQDMAEDSEFSYFYKVLEQDSYNRVTSYLSGNGLITTKEYDEAGALNHITTGYNFDDGIRDLSFEYDLLANVTNRKDQKLNVNQLFEYDNLNRVISATTETSSTSSIMSYNYNSIGNMTSKSDIGDYSYNSNMNGPHQVSNIGSKTFTYDKNGNMINNDGTTLEYTTFNKIAKIKTPNDTISFKYDTSKRRYKKSTSKYDAYYLGKSYEKRINHDNTIQEKCFIYVGSKVISIYENSTTPSTKYLHYDSLNSVDTITNNIGVVESRAAYKVFGEKLNLQIHPCK